VYHITSYYWLRYGFIYFHIPAKPPFRGTRSGQAPRQTQPPPPSQVSFKTIIYNPKTQIAMVEAADILPIYKVEHNAILSMQGDITIAYEVTLPEIFTLSDRDYEAYHQVWIRAIKVLPQHSVFHKQDWFTEDTYKADFEKAGNSFLSRSSEIFFNERPCLDHRCYIFLTQKPKDRRLSSSF